MKKLSNIEAGLKKSVAYTKERVLRISARPFLRVSVFSSLIP